VAVANKPVLHAHDHQHGGADPVRITWESTGEAGEGGGGIMFDTDPQAGGWLEVETDGPGTTEAGYGIELFDASGNGIDLTAGSGGNVYLLTTGGGDIILQPTGAILLTAAAIYMQDLPASDPGVPGRLWRDSSGFLRVSL
jgi:hypothetical protein